MLCATVNEVTIFRSCDHAAAEQQETDQEEDVVGADRDVLDSGEHELLDHRQRSLGRAHVVGHARLSSVQDHLSGKLCALINVEERLVRRVVREERAPDLQDRGIGRGVVEAHPRTAPVWNDRHVHRRWGDLRAVHGQGESRHHHCRQLRAVVLDEIGVEDAVLGRQSKIVRDVEGVHHDGGVDAVARHLQIDIAEGRRVGGHSHWNQEQPEHRAQPADPHTWPSMLASDGSGVKRGEVRGLSFERAVGYT